MRSVNELELPAFSQVFKQFREISEQVFSSLFVAGMEHLLMYCKGKFFEDFIKTVFNMLSEEQLETCKEHFFDVFDDFDELIEKKQMRILSSMIYDYNFTNLLTNISELIEVPIIKSSENEELNELEFLCKTMKISFVILTPKWKELKILNEGSFVSFQILKVESKFYVLYPVEYQELLVSLKVNQKGEIEEDMRKVNKHEDQDECYRSFSSGFTRNTKRGLSVDLTSKLGAVSENDKESRMRNRAKLLKTRREQKRQEELKIKLEKERKDELARIEKQRLEEENDLKEEQTLRERIRLEEENRLLKEWKNHIETQNFNQYTEDFSEKQQTMLQEERQILESQKKEVEILIQAKQELIEELQIAEEIRQREEKKLVEEIFRHEQKKMEMEKSIMEEKRLLELQRIENDRKLAEEKEKIEEMRKAEQKRLEKEFKRIDERRLAQDKKIAEEKRLAAQRKLEDYRRQVADKGKLSDARATPISVVGNAHGSFDGIFECVKVAEFEVNPQITIKVKDEVKTDENQIADMPSENPLSVTNIPEKGVRNIKRRITEAKLKKVEEGANDPEKIEEHKKSEEINKLEKTKQLMELRKIELEKILKDKKQLEIKRDAKRKRTNDAAIFEDKKRIMEIIKKEEEKKHETGQKIKIDIRSPENLNEKKPSIDEIFANCDIFSKKSPENLNESIEDMRIKYEEKMLEKSNNSPVSFNSPESEEKCEDSILENIEPFENSIIKLEKVPETSENLETYIGNCDNNTVCGGLYCAKCMKELKKSNFVLNCIGCCNKYSPQGANQLSKVASPKKLICMNCTAKITKGDEVYCLCCFIQVVVYKKGRQQCEGCFNPGSNYWIDASEGTEEEKILCSFCNEKMRKEAILSTCEKCEDLVCFVCLRKNPYIAQGTCSVCHNRRQISFINP